MTKGHQHMSLYVIAKANEEDVLDTVIFYAGEEGDQEAVAVFTAEAAAQKYLEEADWDEPHEPFPLEPLALLQWLQQAYGQGVRYVTVNPQREAQDAGQPQTVLSVEEQLHRCGESLAETIAAATS
jgi:hypothetical protein